MPLKSSQSRGIFQQLAEESQPGVKCVIENHDAWVNSAEVEQQLTAILRERIAREPRLAVVADRIRQQREKLATLAITLPTRARSAS